jgi:hypothetical protein
MLLIPSAGAVLSCAILVRLPPRSIPHNNVDTSSRRASGITVENGRIWPINLDLR